LLKKNIDQLINSIPKWDIKYITIQTDIDELTCLNKPRLDLSSWLILVSTNNKCFAIFDEETLNNAEKYNKISRDSFVTYLNQNKDLIIKIAFKQQTDTARDKP